MRGTSSQTDASESCPDKVQFDYNHPKYYTLVHEVDENGDFHDISQPQSFNEYTADAPRGSQEFLARVVSEQVNAEVDLDSRILIQFDREWMILCGKSRIDAAIAIEGRVKGATEVRNIEIPGYSIVGRTSETASARIQSSVELFEVVSELARKNPFSSKWQQYRFSADSQLGTEARSRSLRDAWKALVADSGRLVTVLSKLIDPERRDAVEVLGRSTGRDPDVLITEAKGVLHFLQGGAPDFAKAGDTDALEAALSQVNDILAYYYKIPDRNVRTVDTQAFRVYGSRDPAAGDEADAAEDIVQREKAIRTFSESAAPYFLYTLKDTDLLVSQTGAKPGEDIIITIWNNKEQQKRQRALLVRLRVKKFGLVPRITDSGLFIKRIGVNRASNQNALDAGREQAVDGSAATVETPEPVQFVPAPGVTFGWTFYERQSPLLRWLSPGFGLNVSFPQFRTRISSFTPTSAFGSEPQLTIREDGDINVATGLIASLFDGAVQATYGWNLTSGAPRTYWGLGFSFVRIVRGVVSGG